MTSGIYKIRNKVNGHCYIGSSVNIYERWKDHIRTLNNNKHKNIYLQRAWNKYGVGCFSFEIIEQCFLFVLILREQFWMDKIKPEYNIAPKAGNTLGVRCSPEKRAKLVAASTGKHFNRNIPKSSEHRKKLSIANFGKKQSQETIAKRIAKTKNPSTETRAKIGTFHKGKPKSPEQRVKMSISQKGRIITQEARKKISDSLRAWYKNKKH